MMKKYRLGEIAKVEISGVDKKIKENETEVLLCNFTNVYHNWNITKDCESNFMKATANKNEIAKFSIHKGQVALTKDSETRDDIGVSTYIADDFENVLLGYHCALVTPDEKILNGNYLNCLLNTKTYQRYFENNASGSGQRFTLSVETLNNIPLSLPPIDEQERIAKVLSDIDSKIALNKKINRELETMAKEIYDYWFVQFCFPNEDGKPYKSSGGKMQWNDVLKREIPTGWEVRKLGDLLVKIDSGKRPKGGIDKSLKTGIPSLGAECIDDLGVFDFSSTPFLPESFKDKLTTGIIENNDILVYKDGAYVGKCTLFRDEFPFKFAAVNEHVFLLKAKDLIFQEYLLFTLKQETYFNIMQTLGKAKAAQPGLNQDDLKSIPIIVPEKNILKQFHKIMNKNLEELFCNAKVNKELTQLRDELLPLLMNGQVVIKK